MDQSQFDSNNGELKRLPKSTVKLITSTQVITSVVSVVKELIENALDAKATSIDIKLENHGFDKIEVRDNGSGIKTTDTQVMAQPHYTSKITHTDDLENLETYGFRGEALGSLCSVANVSITTKTVSDDVSMTYMISHEGKVMDTKPSHLGQGTTVSATNLFKNLPVRRQFYSSSKKRKDEMKRVEDLVIACSIVSHDVRFSLRHNKDVIWQKNPVADVRGALISVFGVNVLSHMVHVKRKCLDPEVDIEVFLPKSSAPSATVTRTTNDRCFIFVNKRTVIMKEAEKLLRKACNVALGVDSGRYPMAFLHLQLMSRCIDVNINPNKTSVLLQEKEKIFEFLTSILEDIYGKVKENGDVAVHNDENKDSDMLNDDKNTNSAIHNNENMDFSLRDDKNSANKTENGPSSSSLIDCKDVNSNDSLSELGLKISFYESTTKQGADCKQGTSTYSISPHNHNSNSNITSLIAANTSEPNEISHADNFSKANESETDTFQEAIAHNKTVASDVGNVKCQMSNSALDSNNETPRDGVKYSEDMKMEASDIDLTLEMLREFENDDISAFDISTPKLDRTAFGPLCTSTQVPASSRQRCSADGEELPNAAADGRQEESRALGSGGGVMETGEGSNLGLSELESDTGKAWAEGTSVKHSGKVVQPVCLLAGVPATSSDGDAISSKNKAESCTAPGSSKTPGNRNRSSIDCKQPTLLDISTTIKRPPSGYLYFSKEVRPAVLGDNPGATFVDLAAIIVEKWKSLSDDERREYEDRAAKEASWLDYEEEIRQKKKNVRQKSSSSKLQASKKRRLSKEDQQSCIQQLFTSATNPKPPAKSSIERTEKSVKFSLRGLQESYHDGPYQSQSQTVAGKSLIPIGQVKSQCAWVCCHENHIKLFQPIRAQEELIYRRLMANHKFTMEPLESPRRLTAESLGAGLWQTLLSLKMSTAQATDPHNYITDLRVTNNGLRIRHRIGSDAESHQRVVEVVAMATSVASFDVKVLIEILEVIRSQPPVQLSNCRPTLVRHYLQSEAVRMTRQLPHYTSRDEVRGLIRDLQCHLVGGTKTCFHGRPILHTIYDLEDIPRSQECGLDSMEVEIENEQTNIPLV